MVGENQVLMIWTMWPLKICASCGHKRIGIVMILSAFSLEGKVAVVTGVILGWARGWRWGWRKRAVTCWH